MKVLSGEVILVCQLNTAGELECSANYDATTADNILHGNFKLKVTDAQASQIKNFISSVVIPQIKLWEAIA